MEGRGAELHVIPKKYTKYYDLISCIGEPSRPLAYGMLDDLLDLERRIRKLRRDVREHGDVDEFQNGAQVFFRESPWSAKLDKLMKQQLALYQQILDLRTKKEREADAPKRAHARDPLADFISDRDDE
jgi:hypothetical protein